MVNTPFVWNPAQDTFYFKKESKVFEKISIRYGLTIDELQKEFTNRTKLIYELYRKKIFGFDDVRKVVVDYYRNSKDVLEKFGIK